jgi:hypothetical protein
VRPGGGDVTDEPSGEDKEFQDSRLSWVVDTVLSLLLDKFKMLSKAWEDTGGGSNSL